MPLTDTDCSEPPLGTSVSDPAAGARRGARRERLVEAHRHGIHESVVIRVEHPQPGHRGGVDVGDPPVTTLTDVADESSADSGSTTEPLTDAVLVERLR